MTTNDYTPLVQINIGLFADKVGVATTNTLDLGQGVHDLALAIDVGVKETQDVLRPSSQYTPTGRNEQHQTDLELLVGLRHDERHGGRWRIDLKTGGRSQPKLYSQRFIQSQVIPSNPQTLPVHPDLHHEILP